MDELPPRPGQITSDMVTQGYKALALKYGSIDPSQLPDDDPAVGGTLGLYHEWQEQQEVHVLADGTPESRLEYEFELTTLLVDAGFQNHDYIDDVANDWLIQTLDKAEGAGLDELALKIKIKVFELNRLLPAEMRLPTAGIAMVLEDLLSPEDCAELAVINATKEEALGYAFTLLIENGVEDPEALLIGKGILE